MPGITRQRTCWEADVHSLAKLGLELTRLSAPLPFWRGLQADASLWIEAAHSVACSGGTLVALWASGTVANAAYSLPEGLVWLALPLDAAAPACADLSPFFPAASRMQRAMSDLYGVTFPDSLDIRPWLKHSESAEYPFVRVAGDGVHEIAVGPVHAGIIEPGHFRFSVVGEKVLRLEERLGYTHKGIEKRFTELTPQEAYRLAGRVSGDSTVAYAWAYCMALESATECDVPQRAQ
ncbi:MAG: hypothetical protein G3I10_06805 [Ferrovum sp.]|nr:hypothetical protein [Ferrovum sp.]